VTRDVVLTYRPLSAGGDATTTRRRWFWLNLATGCFAAWLLVVVYLENARVTAPFRGSLHDLIYYFPPVHLCSFLLGVTGGAWYLTDGQARRRSRLTTSLLATASLLVTYFAIEYRANTAYLGVYSSFADDHEALLASCRDLARASLIADPEPQAPTTPGKRKGR